MRRHLGRCVLSVTLTLVSIACSGGGGSSSGGNPPAKPGNVLVILADDVGVDKIHCYGEHPSTPPTPNIDQLAAQGVLFRRAYVQPWCSPTRACILTGRYGFRTGVGNPVNQNVADAGLPLAEFTLPELLHTALGTGVKTCAIGKWHLNSWVNGDTLNPNEQGFEWFEGTPGNFSTDDYFVHTKVTNGLPAISTTYATTEQVDDALWRIESMPQPWFLYLSFNAAHQPFHAPPPALHTYNLSGDPNATPIDHVAATVQAIDTEVGRLLQSMDPAVLANTTILFLGDNGSDPDAIAPPWPDNGKGSLYEGGVRVPLIVSGKEVGAAGREEDGFVQAVDLFATIADLFDVDVPSNMPDNRPLDSRSFAAMVRAAGAAPIRSEVYAESFAPNGFGPYTAKRRMLRDDHWKVIEHQIGPDEFYDMQGLSFEGLDLMQSGMTQEQQSAYQTLKTELSTLAGD